MRKPSFRKAEYKQLLALEMEKLNSELSDYRETKEGLSILLSWWTNQVDGDYYNWASIRNINDNMMPLDSLLRKSNVHILVECKNAYCSRNFDKLDKQIRSMCQAKSYVMESKEIELVNVCPLIFVNSLNEFECMNDMKRINTTRDVALWSYLFNRQHSKKYAVIYFKKGDRLSKLHSIKSNGNTLYQYLEANLKIELRDVEEMNGSIKYINDELPQALKVEVCYQLFNSVSWQLYYQELSPENLLPENEVKREIIQWSKVSKVPSSLPLNALKYCEKIGIVVKSHSKYMWVYNGPTNKGVKKYCVELVASMKVKNSISKSRAVKQSTNDKQLTLF